MKDYVKPIIPVKPDHILPMCGSRLFFISRGWWKGNKQPFKVGLMKGESSYQELLKRDDFLAIEKLKIMKDITSTLVGEMFSLNEENRYELQTHTDFTI